MPQIKSLYFDFDNTLTDFHRSSKLSFSDLLRSLDIVELAEDYEHYSRINGAIWRKFERAEISSDDIRSMRFAEYFSAKKQSVPSAWVANAEYLEGILRHTEPIDGAKEMLAFAKKHFELVIVTNGLKEIQRRRIEKLAWTDYFEEIFVSDELGVAKPYKEFFATAFAHRQERHQKNEVLMIGDSLGSDIKGGKEYGFRTCWITPQKFPKSAYADYHVHSVSQLHELLRSLSNL